MSKIKYPYYNNTQTIGLLNGGTTPVSLDDAPRLLNLHHFVLAWDGEVDNFCSVSLGILTAVSVTASKMRYTVHACNTDFDLTYDNAACIHDERCPEVLVKTEKGAFVGKLVGIDYDKGMAVVRDALGTVGFWSISIVTYIDDMNMNHQGLRAAEPDKGDENVG